MFENRQIQREIETGSDLNYIRGSRRRYASQLSEFMGNPGITTNCSRNVSRMTWPVCVFRRNDNTPGLPGYYCRAVPSCGFPAGGPKW